MELLGDGQRAVAADAHEALEAKLLDRALHAFEQLAFDFDAIGNAGRGGEPALVRRAEDRAALVQNAGRVLRRQRDVLHRVVQALVALEEADAVVTQAASRFSRRRGSRRSVRGNRRRW